MVRPMILKLTDGAFQIKLGGTSATVLETNDGPILIDTGWHWSRKKIQVGLNIIGYSLKDIHLIALTHFHPDHIGSAKLFKETLRTQIAAHVKDAEIVSRKKSIHSTSFSRYGKFILNPFLSIVRGGIVEPEILLTDGEKLPTELDVETIHTPGHTQGSICFYIPEKKLLIAGDAMEHRNGDLMPPSKFFSQNVAMGIESIKKLEKLDCEIISLSHFDPVLSKGNKLITRFINRYLQNKNKLI